MNATAAATSNTMTEVPDNFKCAMTKELMFDPMMSKHGQHFERSAILRWLDQGHTYCPVSHKPLRPSNLISDKALQNKIQAWMKNNDYQHPSAGQPQASNANKGNDADITDDSFDEAIDRRIVSAQISLTPQQYICPLTGKIMKDPVMTKTGINYERKAILKFLQKKGCVCPVTNKPLAPSGVIANSKLGWEINQWQLHHGMATPSKRASKSLSPKRPTNRSAPQKRASSSELNQSYHGSTVHTTAIDQVVVKRKSATSTAATKGFSSHKGERDSWCNLSISDVIYKGRTSQKDTTVDTDAIDAVDQVPRQADASAKSQPELTDVLENVMEAIHIE